MPEQAVKSFIADRRQRGAEAAPSTPGDNILFHMISDDSLQTLLSHSHIDHRTPGRQIVQQGDNADFLYFIIKGRVKTHRFSAAGGEATIRMLQAGDTFMDAVIFMGGKSPVSAMAIEDTQLLLIPAEAVRRHALHDPQFSCNLLKIIARHYKNALQQIDCVITKNPVERIGYYFLRQQLEQDGLAREIPLPFQKATIANHLGMTPETFSRALGTIRKMGIDLDQEKMTLKNPYALCRFCDPDTAHACPKRETPGCLTAPGKNAH